MLPIFELKIIHKKRAICNLTHPYIAGANPELTPGKTHGRRAIATPAALVKKQGPMFPAQLLNHLHRFI